MDTDDKAAGEGPDQPAHLFPMQEQRGPSEAGWPAQGINRLVIARRAKIARQFRPPKRTICAASSGGAAISGSFANCRRAAQPECAKQIFYL
jgi:hypothetical protein